jgi:glycosyltransferase involved in cell wall biosynthesis
LTPLISLLIPSRNRANYLSSLISIIEKCSDDRIEFLISDNSDESGISPCAVGNVTYFRPERILNMTDHWNFLLPKATGKYISVVGDDDAFIPSALEELCNVLERISPDLVWTGTAGYGWPTPGNHGNFFGTIQQNFERVTLEKARLRLLNLHSVDLPIPYNGTLVKRQVIGHFLKENPGENFFSSRVPDINAGVKALFLSNSQFDFKQLTFISGASQMSNGLQTRTNQNHPVTLEFNNPRFNPLTNRTNSQVKEICPFGFMTHFEAIEESLLQLGETLSCRPEVVAFRSVFKSSFPKNQLKISLKMWKRYLPILYLAYLLNRTTNRKIFVKSSQTFKLAIMGFKIITRKEKVLIIRGPGIYDTASLVDYLETNRSVLSKKYIERIYVQ